MTNYPPPPQGQPPYGQPQFGQQQVPNYAPPPGAYGMAPQQQSNGWGVASLITGIISMCVPILGGLLAIIFGMVGIKKAGKTHTGKGLAIAGLILGLLTTIGYAVTFAVSGAAIWAVFEGTAVNRDLAKQFLNDLAADNIAAAATAVDPAAITEEDLKELAPVLDGHGEVAEITTVGFQANQTATGSTVVLAGSITFSDGTAKSFEMRQKKLNDAWKIEYVRIQ